MLPIRVLNFDDSLSLQHELITRFNPVFTDLREFSPYCRQWMNMATLRRLKSALDPTLKNSITFLGSGDFHHISSLLIEQFSDPISLIVFDHHPDWDILPPKYGCGSWVTQVLKMPNLQKVVLLGVSSHDISTFAIHTGNLKALENNRVEIYPYQHPPTKVVFRKVPDNCSIEVKRDFLLSEIRWRELKKRNLSEFFALLKERIPTKQIYISIDKDCLHPDYALTNWEKGYFKLDELLLLLKMFKDNFSLVGVDITGDYSPIVKIHGRLKAKLAAWDHPQDYTARSHTIYDIGLINESTNIKILETLT